jgi:hypothetical protein
MKARFLSHVCLPIALSIGIFHAAHAQTRVDLTNYTVWADWSAMIDPVEGTHFAVTDNGSSPPTLSSSRAMVVG